MIFSGIKAVVSDMDGVLWRGMEALPGLVDFFAFLRAHQIPFMLATNNSGKHPDNYVEKLAILGVDGIEARHIVSSGTATVDYLQAHFAPHTKIFVIGNAGLFQLIEEAEFEITAEDAQVVVVGIDFDFSYEKARTASLLIRNHGAVFIGTNPDLTFPSPEGLVPGAGSVIKMIEAATDIAPTIIGKPRLEMFEVALQRLGTRPAETLMIGDRLDTDIVGAAEAGLRTALLLTGVNSRADAAQTDTPPDVIFHGLPELTAAWAAEIASAAQL